MAFLKMPAQKTNILLQAPSHSPHSAMWFERHSSTSYSICLHNLPIAQQKTLLYLQIIALLLRTASCILKTFSIESLPYRFGLSDYTPTL